MDRRRPSVAEEPQRNWCALLPWERFGKAMACEFLGCFFINFFGCGAAIASGGYGYLIPRSYNLSADDQFLYGDDYHMVVSFAFGFIMMVNIAMFLHVSGSHVNPTVTLGMLIIRKVSLIRALLYVPLQLLGCLAGSGLLKVVTPTLNHRSDVFAPFVNSASGVTWWQAALWELFLSYLMVLVFMVLIREMSESNRAMAPLVVGVTVILNHMAALFATTGCNNPARAIGASIVSLEFDHIWVFVAFSPLGGILGALTHYFFFMEGKRDEDDEGFLSGIRKKKGAGEG